MISMKVKAMDGMILLAKEIQLLPISPNTINPSQLNGMACRGEQS